MLGYVYYNAEIWRETNKCLINVIDNRRIKKENLQFTKLESSISSGKKALKVGETYYLENRPATYYGYINKPFARMFIINKTIITSITNDDRIKEKYIEQITESKSLCIIL